MAIDYERFRRNARAAGERPEDTENTVQLFKEIEKALEDDPYMAPELGTQEEMRVIRLARLFLNKLTEQNTEGSKIVARWLRSHSVSEELVSAIERGEHWKWWHAEGKKQS